MARLTQPLTRRLTIPATLRPVGHQSVVLRGLRPFAFASEADTLAASFSTPPTTARKRTLDHAIKRLKAAGIWQKATAIYAVGADENASFKNWKTPGTFDLTKVGAPTFTANQGWVGVSNTGYLNTNMPANTLSRDNIGHYVWSTALTASDSGDYGAIDASSRGISMVCRAASNNVMRGRCSGANQASLSANGHSDGYGLHGGSRAAAGSWTGCRNGVPKNTISEASFALPSINIFLLSLNNNGTPTTTAGRAQACWYFGQALTNEQEIALTAIFGEYTESVRFGEPIIEEPGIGTAEISAECIFYGTTPQSVCGALQAARAGRTVAIVGGWRDRTIGGMSAGGLGFTDFDNQASLGGLPRYIITRMNALEGVADNKFYFFPRRFRYVMLELLNPALNGGFSIPVYYTKGVTSVSKTGAAITSFRTADGRNVSGSQFFDGSYEGDLLRLAGCGYIIGREAAGSGKEALNGRRTVVFTDSEGNHQFKNHAGAQINIDPWITSGVPASGLLQGVKGVRTTFTPALNTEPAAGTADSYVQGYNFRLTMVNDVIRSVPLPATPPSGYDVNRYELLLRYLAADATITFTDLFIVNSVGGAPVVYDVNAKWGFSTDLFGGNHAYPTASYTDREFIWKDHWNFILGMLYTLQYGTDPRIPAALQTEALTYGFDQTHYYTTHENDEVFWNPQFYVREAIRMVSDAIFNGNDLNMTDASAPRISNKTVSVASYKMDSHSNQRIAYEVSAGVWRAWNEGGFESNHGGVDLTTPIPYEICIPKAAECTNLSVGFAVSATHVAFGSIRMEFTAMQIGQSMGHAMALAVSGATTIQAVDYSTLRTALLASPALSGEVAPVLPQVN